MFVAEISAVWMSVTDVKQRHALSASTAELEYAAAYKNMSSLKYSRQIVRYITSFICFSQAIAISVQLLAATSVTLSII